MGVTAASMPPGGVEPAILAPTFFCLCCWGGGGSLTFLGGGGGLRSEPCFKVARAICGFTNHWN